MHEGLEAGLYEFVCCGEREVRTSRMYAKLGENCKGAANGRGGREPPLNVLALLIVKFLELHGRKRPVGTNYLDTICKIHRCIV